MWYDFLSKHEYKFRRQKPIDKYIVDFYCEKANLVIEIDGAQHYEPEEIKYDKQRTEILSSLGLKVIRFTNSDIDKNFDGVCQYIDKEIAEIISK